MIKEIEKMIEEIIAEAYLRGQEDILKQLRDQKDEK